MVLLEGSLSPHPQSPFTLALGVTTPSQPGGALVEHRTTLNITMT